MYDPPGVLWDEIEWGPWTDTYHGAWRVGQQHGVGDDPDELHWRRWIQTRYHAEVDADALG